MTTTTILVTRLPLSRRYTEGEVVHLFWLESGDIASLVSDMVHDTIEKVQDYQEVGERG